MSRDEIRKQVRREIRSLRLGTAAEVACAVCGESDQNVLRRPTRRLVEFHHLAGVANDAELGVFLCLTHHELCSELMRDGFPLRHGERRALLERLVAVLRGLAIFFGLANQVLDSIADDLVEQISALDDVYSGWRDLDESR
jgi:hypothetical protein